MTISYLQAMATVQVRPRGWHLFEKHLEVDGRPVPGGIFDFALHMFHSAGPLLQRGSGPYFYLPKMQSHLEARLWNDIFVDAQVRPHTNAHNDLPSPARPVACLPQAKPLASALTFLHQGRRARPVLTQIEPSLFPKVWHTSAPINGTF